MVTIASVEKNRQHNRECLVFISILNLLASCSVQDKQSSTGATCHCILLSLLSFRRMVGDSTAAMAGINPQTCETEGVVISC